MHYSRRTWRGAIDMGRPRVPPLPQAIQMIDRDDGTVYLLSHTGEVGSLELDLTATLYTKPDVVTYGPNDGPYLNGNIRLYVASGSLAGELVDAEDTPAVDYRSPRVLTRSGFARTMLEITADDDWTPGDEFTYTEVTL